MRLKTIFTAVCMLLLCAGAAYASESGAEHPLPWGNLALRVLNFALFIGILAYFFGGKIKGFFKGRTQQIADELSSLEERKNRATAALANVEERIKNLEQERKTILDEYRAQGEAAKAAIIAQAEEAAARLQEQAKRTAQNEISQAVETIRAEMAEKIVLEAERMLAERLSAQEHAKLIDQYLTKVVLN